MCVRFNEHKRRFDKALREYDWLVRECSRFQENGVKWFFNRDITNRVGGYIAAKEYLELKAFREH